MKTAVVESPYAANTETGATVEDHEAYLDECLLWCMKNDLSPYASHAIIPRVYNDLIPEERKAGIGAGYFFQDIVDEIIFFTDMGWSSGMRRAKERCLEKGLNYREVTIR
jgi:hypothetical protein